MQTTANTTPRVYVGTYRKYNNGSLGGAWVDLEPFAGDLEGFIKHCFELHKDEHEPEFMFQDFEGFPREFYGESSIGDGIWEWLELDEDDREILAAYIDATGDEGVTIRDAQDHYVGTYASGAEFAEHTAEECGDTKGMPDWLVHCIDWDRAWECELRFDYTTSERGGGLYIFHN